MRRVVDPSENQMRVVTKFIWAERVLPVVWLHPKFESIHEGCWEARKWWFYKVVEVNCDSKWTERGWLADE
jgi:hypothetical protein